MQRSIKMLGPTLLAALALIAVVASPAFAEWKEFEANKTGKLAGKALNIQKFKTKETGGATVECEKLTTPNSTVTELKTTKQAVNVQYETCSIALIGKATVTEANYTFFTPLKVSLGKAVIIKAGVLGEECEIEVGPQELGAGLAKSGKMELEYRNTTSSTGKGSITLEAEVEHIKSKILKTDPVKELACGKAGEESTTGIYTGNSEIEEEGAGNNIKVV